MRYRMWLPVCLVAVCLCVGCGPYRTSGPAPGEAPRLDPLESSPPVRPAEAVKPDALRTLEACIAHAMLHNAGLEAAFDRWKASAEAAHQVTALPDPRFTYKYFIREIETRVGPQRQAFAIAQTFPWLGKLRLRGDAAAAAAEAARFRYDAARLELVRQVTDAYYERYYVHRALLIVRQNIQLVRHMESVARTRYKTSAGGHPVVIRAQLELGRLEDRVRSVEDLRGPVAARLNAALNRPPDAPLPEPQPPKDVALDATDAEVLAALAEHSPRLQELQAETHRARAGIALAEKDYLPDVTVGVGYMETGKAVGPMRPADSGRDPVFASVSVNLPLWRGKLDAGLRAARRRKTAFEMARRQAAADLSARAKLVLFRHRDARRRVSLYRDTLIPKATQAVKASETAFRAGKASFTDLIDAQRVLLMFELSTERARADAAQRLAELDALVGRRLSVEHVTTPGDGS